MPDFHAEEGNEQEIMEEREWFEQRVVDKTGDLARVLAGQIHAGDPDGEGVIWYDAFIICTRRLWQHHSLCKHLYSTSSQSYV